MDWLALALEFSFYGFVAADKTAVGPEALLQQILPAVDDPGFFALGDEGADAGRGVKGGDARATGAEPLR